MYDSKHDQIQLIDFGASREYTKQFMDSWFTLLNAALTGDKAGMKEESLKIGYLTGEENDVRYLRLQSHETDKGCRKCWKLTLNQWS
jgi:predicted unusual protein kinase regulating ubiquinone biosynthesis (AarF/ABC1/UbiB family)